MTTTLTASTELQLSADIAEANAATSGNFIIELQSNIFETANLAAIDLQAGVALVINAGGFTLDGAGLYDGISVVQGGTGSAVTLQNLEINNVASAQPATLSGGTLSGPVSNLANAIVDQTGDIALGDVTGSATFTNQGTFEIDQLVAGASGPAIDGVAGSVFINQGLLVKPDNSIDSPGVSEFYVNVTDTGTFSVPAYNSNLRFDGAVNSFSGLYIGGGMIDYGDPATYESLGYGSYSVANLGSIDMSNGACTTTWAEVNQSGPILISYSTSINNYGTWDFTSDNGLALEDPSSASISAATFILNNVAVMEKTNGSGSTIIGMDFNRNSDSLSNQGGFIEIASGTLAFDGYLNNFYSTVSGSGTFSIGGGGSDEFYSGTTISVSNWVITGTSTDVTLNVPLRYSGMFAQQSGATLALAASTNLTLSHATFNGIVTAASGAAIELASAATLEIDDLASTVSGVQVQNFNAPVGGLTGGDILRLEGYGAFATINGTTPKYDSGTNTTSLILTDNGSVVATLNLAGGNYSNAVVAPDPLVSGAMDVTVACFCRGTRLLTTRGEVAVEDLQPGDLAVTASGKPAPVRWIGHRHIDCARHRRSVDVWPVRIVAGAFAPGQPARDVWLSPDHAVACAGRLIPVRYLINGRTIVQEPLASVMYFHVELADHDLLLAEGLPCESYLDTGNRGAFSNGDGAVDLHPDFSRRVWAASSCAPLLLDGPELIETRRGLLHRAHECGSQLTDMPDLRLLADGRALETSVGGRIWRAHLPRETRSVRLLSRRWVPGHTLADGSDMRTLGVAISHLWLDGEAVDLDSGCFGAGWHASETDWRWTDGDGRVAPAGARLIAFALALTGTYWNDIEDDAALSYRSSQRSSNR